jgi:hypothetical protein
MAMGANIVDRVSAVIQLEDSDVAAFGGDGDACTFKQFGLSGHIGPISHSFFICS